jgi:outer membrane protein assembly factor BamB
MVIYPHTDSYLYAVKDGNEVWSYSVGMGNSIEGPACVAKDRVIIGVGKGRRGFLTCLALKPTGDQKPFWTYPSFGDPNLDRLSVPCLVDADGSTVYAAAGMGDLVAVDLQSGRRIASFEIGIDVVCPMALWEGLLYAVTGDFQLHAIDFSGIRKNRPVKKLWSFPIGQSVKAGLKAHGGFLVVCTEEGKVLALDTRDRDRPEVKWTEQVEGAIVATPVVSANTLFFGAYDKTLYSHNFWTGERNWAFAIPGRVNGLAVRDDTIFLTTQEGDLLAVRNR